MKFTALKNDIKEGTSNIYLLEGEEAYFTDRGVDMIKSAFVREASIDYSSFEGSAIKGNGAEDFVAAVYAYPFLSAKRVVRVNQYYPTEKEFERVKSVFESPSETTVLVIVNTAKPKTGAVDLKKKPNVTFVDCSKADEEDVLKWIFVTFKKAGVAVDSSTCSLIASYCAMGMSRVAKETEKLIEYAGEGGRILPEDVESLVYKETDYKLYEMTNAVARKNYTAFLAIMTDMLSKGYDEMSFLSALGNYYKNLYDALTCPLSDKGTADLLGVKEYAIKKNREQARKIGKEKIEEFCSVFYGAVSEIKSGRTTPSSALSLSVAKIFFGA